MELARDKNESPPRYSNCRCAGIAGARRESGRAVTRNGRMPSRSAGDAGFFEGTAHRCARITDAACRGPLQQARASRGGWRTFPYNVLRVGLALLCEPRRAEDCPPYRSRVRFDGRARHSVRAVLLEYHSARRGLRALPMRRRAIVRAIYPQPIFNSLAQSFANRIHQDVAGFLVQFVMVAQAVIAKIALPIHAMFSGDELFPVLDGCCHSRFARECHDRVEMIRHKQAEAAMPEESLVVEPHRSEHGIANGRARHSVRAGLRTQLVFARRHAVNGDKEPTALGH